MNYAAAKFYLDFVLIVINLAIGIYVWWTNRDKITNGRFKKLEDKMIKIETKLETPPKPCDQHTRMEENDREISKRLDEMHGAIKKIEGIVEGRMKGIGTSLDIIQQHLMGGGR